MSYLNLPRLTFAGLFEADVNTVNNDVRNFSASTFEPRFQTPQVQLPGGKTEFNGWWNPNGSNNFRLLQCVTTGAAAPHGMACADADPALGLTVDAQISRTAAKIVDLDPQFQFASAIWGMRIALMGGDTLLMSAEFLPASFRDIYFGRLINEGSGQPVPGSSGASARFTGTLARVAFTAEAARSPFLRALETVAKANDGRLSMSLMTYGYRRTAVKDGRTFGSVIGSIGPWLRGEPLNFAPGRRFAPVVTQDNPFAGASGIGFMNAALAPDKAVLSVDFGMSLPLLLSSEGTGDAAQPIILPMNIGPLRVVVQKQADGFKVGADGALELTAVTAAGDKLNPGQYEEIGVIQGYDFAWLRRTGGIVDLPVPPAARALIHDHPLAILSSDPKSGETIAIRETVAGLWVRADDFVQRLDTAKEGWTASTASLHAMKYGAPYAGAPLNVSLQPEQQGAGGTDDPNEVKPPQAPIPPINVPSAKISLPSALTAGPDGVATLTYQALDPGNPRGYIDGQIYVFKYSFAVSSNSPSPQSPMPRFENIAVHVRNAFTPPATPSWETDIAPILIQYGNLYPIMSRGLFSLSDYATVVANARLLYLAFTLPIDDPNYMPATRDLSAGKRAMLLSWLAGYLTGAPGDYGALPVLPAGAALENPLAPVVTGADHPTHLTEAVARAAIASLGDGNDGKTAAVRAFLSGSFAQFR
jgi:hypothetical protein